MSNGTFHPVAIAMWDFSWLERRWPGAGYEDWDVALDDLAERGYDAVRIDAYPHLVSRDATATWDLVPTWTQQSWGAQSNISVQVVPSLIDFMRKAHDRGIKVALSSWFRPDRTDTRMRITTPQQLGEAWVETLRQVEAAGLLDSVLYVDLCNEFPLAIWSPYLYGSDDAESWPRTDPRVPTYMELAIDVVRAAFPQFAYTFSFTGEYSTWREQQVPGLDLLEPHIWMCADDVTDIYEKAGYGFERFDPVGYENLVARDVKGIYLARQDTYDKALFRQIDEVAEWSRATQLPLVTTECWSIIDYKDWPGLDWDWVLDFNARAVEHVVGTGRWVGIGTSNFCGPQFHGVWREVDYHQRLTSLIKSSVVSDVPVVSQLAQKLHCA